MTNFFVAVSADQQSDETGAIYGIGQSADAAIADAIKQSGYADIETYLHAMHDAEGYIDDHFKALPASPELYAFVEAFGTTDWDYVDGVADLELDEAIVDEFADHCFEGMEKSAEGVVGWDGLTAVEVYLDFQSDDPVDTLSYSERKRILYAANKRVRDAVAAQLSERIADAESAVSSDPIEAAIIKAIAEFKRSGRENQDGFSINIKKHSDDSYSADVKFSDDYDMTVWIGEDSDDEAVAKLWDCDPTAIAYLAETMHGEGWTDEE